MCYFLEGQSVRKNLNIEGNDDNILILSMGGRFTVFESKGQDCDRRSRKGRREKQNRWHTRVHTVIVTLDKIIKRIGSVE